VFYFFMSDRIKSLFSKAVWIMCGVSIIDYMLFGTNLGILSSTLQYDNTPVFELKDYIINMLTIIAAAVVLCFLIFKFPKVVRYIQFIGALSVAFLGLINFSFVWNSYNWFLESNIWASYDEPMISLSTQGKNVVVLMLDRAIGTEVPYAFNERPELVKQFDGFTYYPNTLSYGICTNIASPALYGGYEYTPENNNIRSDESLESKHNEALKVMPVLFGENGYNVTICDPSYAGYQWIPDLSIYDDYPEFNCYNLNGHFNLFEEEINGEKTISPTSRINDIRNRNFYCYSIMKIAPLILQDVIYDDGLYNEAMSIADNSGNTSNLSVLVQRLDGLSKSYGFSQEFIKSYAVLQRLNDITKISNGEENTFLMMSNDITHAPCLLQEPDYVPELSVDNTAYDVDMVSRYTIDGKTMEMTDEHQVITYHVNMAAYIQLGKWFDYLRENGVYDNSRIILVADHGINVSQFNVACHDMDMECFMPLLMVKDFNAKGFTVCDDFMTNGDTPVIATSGLIDNPVNPFTGNPITSDAKEGPQTVIFSNEADVKINNGNTFLPGSWFVFTGGDIHDPDNWSYLGDY
ncbi:MAG: hypothetical protein K6E72_05500, partial [Saccharofermentans sp.]|nr:hypothetical protein [Saccharofermentans sp.]